MEKTETKAKREPSPRPFRVLLDGRRNFILPPEAHTWEGFRLWADSEDFPDQGRISYLSQEIYLDMAPEELDTHNKIKLEISRVLATWIKRQNQGEFYADRALLTNEEVELSTEPDALFLLWSSLESGRARLIPRAGALGQYIEIEGSADWSLEVVSESSIIKDTERLRDLYYRSGVTEYWLVDARGPEIDFQILTRGEGELIPSTASERKNVGRKLTGGWQLSPLFQRRFRLVRERNRLDLWSYDLEMKSAR